ncbi:MAG: hypothetical protein JWM61_2971 [Micrococcaceae bacterium]|nr:hypothetical protein [Micrococcaceae bacterium]
MSLSNHHVRRSLTTLSTSSGPKASGHVREFGEGLLQTDPNVRAFSLEPDGSSANVILDESLRAISEVSDLEHRYSEAADCPIRVSFGSIQPAL